MKKHQDNGERKTFFGLFQSRNRKIKQAVHRIERMESLFDKISNAYENRSDELNSPQMLENIKTLSDYYFGGEWLGDHDLDEQRLLPPDLKRGVLSQDGVYNLLCSIKEEQEQ